MVQLPYFAGCKYAAYSAENSEEVRKLDVPLNHKNHLLCYKVGTVTWYQSRPEFLVYHIHSFHVLEMKVFNKY